MLRSDFESEESPFNLRNQCSVLPRSFKISSQRQEKSQAAVDCPGLGEHCPNFILYISALCVITAFD